MSATAANHKWPDSEGAAKTLKFNITKATPTVAVPTPEAVTYDRAKTLADVALTGGWAWTDSSTVPAVGNSGYQASLDVDDANYDYAGVEGYSADTHKVTRTVELTVNKADAVPATVTANSRTYDGTEKPLVNVAGEPVGGEMRYALGTDATTAPADGWSTTVPTGTEIGTYYVWYKVVGDANHKDSVDCVTVTIRQQSPATVTRIVMFEVEGGSWDDGTDGTKTVELTGIAGSTLKLGADQIPAVGSKPADGFEAGAWDPVPSADAAITRDTTYKYSYARKGASGSGVSAKVTFKVENGAWDDGTTADKEVTVTAATADALKLAAEQVPAAGSKPASGFQAGAWDKDPLATAPVKDGMAFTYEYAKKGEGGNPDVPAAVGGEVGKVYEVAGSYYVVTGNSPRTAALVKAAAKKKVTVPPKVTINSATYKVTAIHKAACKDVKTLVVGKNVKQMKEGAFKGCPKLKKKTVKRSLEGSKVKTVKVKADKAKARAKLVKKYKRAFAKKNSGRAVKVKR